MSYRGEDDIYTVAIPGDLNMLHMTAFLHADSLQPVDDAFLESYATSGSTSPRMFAGVRSSIGFITKKLITFVPGGSGPKPLFAMAVVVDSPFGRGVVVNFRELDRVYELQLFRSDAKTQSGEVSSPIRVFVQERHLQLSSNSPSRGFFSMLGLRSGSGASAITPALNRVPVGSGVETPYGKGVVRDFRAGDEIYAVALSDWALGDGHHAMAYLTKDFFLK
ncbi:Hypothetical protein PHPALM_18888 [Phytophthora palmivora]|uniref:Uncharacterized protein n=1 Tax=Phytophthora palmivora TaxID=4796 RepID=A0A2P4XIL6_9STRA|nr:Hypothetical protein PHPALM_18888 [Phytophthora palmivora]